MLFVAFGALVLVPLLTGLNPNVALFTAGLGTLIFQLITIGKFSIGGIGLAGIVGVLLNLVLPGGRSAQEFSRAHRWERRG
jgi:xanthine/uracil permease